MFSESAVTFLVGTVALSAKYPLTTGDLTSAKSCAADQSPYVTSLVTKLTLAVRVNLTSCVTTFGVLSSFNTGVLSAYTYVILRVTVLFRSFSSNPAGYLGPSGLVGSTGVPGVFGWSGVTVTTRSLSVTVYSWSVSTSLSNTPSVGYVLDTTSYPLFWASLILLATSSAFVSFSPFVPVSEIGSFPSTCLTLPSLSW